MASMQALQNPSRNIVCASQEHASTDVMPTRNPVDRLSVDKGLGTSARSRPRSSAAAPDLE